jgi:hypothetical protein
LADLREEFLISGITANLYEEFARGTVPPSRGGGRIVVNGVISPKGLCFLGYEKRPSLVRYRLGKQYRTFHTLVGVDDNDQDRDFELTFVVTADGKVVWTSDPVKKTRSPPQRCTLHVAGVDQLSLEIRIKGIGHPSAVWFEPYLEK